MRKRANKMNGMKMMRGGGMAKKPMKLKGGGSATKKRATKKRATKKRAKKKK
tara:strand:- start:687 stop:842 length:156 start_codon:yes stop_codon:yes gene_type:complete